MPLRDELYNLLYSRFWPSFASKLEHVSITALSKVSRGGKQEMKVANTSSKVCGPGSATKNYYH